MDESAIIPTNNSLMRAAEKKLPLRRMTCIQNRLCGCGIHVSSKAKPMLHTTQTADIPDVVVADLKLSFAVLFCIFCDGLGRRLGRFADQLTSEDKAVPPNVSSLNNAIYDSCLLFWRTGGPARDWWFRRFRNSFKFRNARDHLNPV